MVGLGRLVKVSGFARLILVLGTVLTVGASSALSAPQAQKPVPLSYATLATTLVARLSHADSDSARTQALIAIARSLQLGVYQGNGNAIVRGSERRPHDFYLYDFELSGIGAALEHKLVWTSDDLSMQFLAIESHPDRSLLDPQTIHADLVAGTRWAVGHPDDPQSLLPLLVRALGMAHTASYDLAQDPPAASVKFDALQVFLIVADTLIPLAQNQQASLENVVAYEPAEGAADDQLLADGPCDFSGDPKSTWKAIKYFGGLLSQLVGAVGKAGSPLIDEMHGILLGLSVDVQTPLGTQYTHWGPNVAGHESPIGETPGTPMVFSVHVVNLTVFPQELIECGVLLGVKLPPPGPMNDVPVTWGPVPGPIGTLGDSDYDKLLEQGDVDEEDSKTHDVGAAILKLTPHDEEVPDFGEVHRESGVLIVSVDYLAGMGNILAVIPELLGCQRIEGIAWFAERHKPKGFRFDVTFQGQYSSKGHEGSRTVELVGEVCGEDPYAPWTITDKESDDFPGSPGTRSGDFESQVDFADGNATWTGPEGPMTEGNEEARDTADLTFTAPKLNAVLPVAAPQMKVNFNFIQMKNGQSPGSQSQTVPVTEPDDCASD